MAFFTIETKGTDALLASLAGFEKEHIDAQNFAANAVAAKARTAASKSIRTTLALSAKAVNKRIKVFRATRRKPWARLWAGTRTSVPWYESGTQNKGVLQTAGAAMFRATMKSGHRGVFYRSDAAGNPRTTDKPLPIREHRVSIKEEVDKVLPEVGARVWKADFDERYWHDFERRIAKKGWR